MVILLNEIVASFATILQDFDLYIYNMCYLMITSALLSQIQYPDDQFVTGHLKANCKSQVQLAPLETSHPDIEQR